MYNIHKLYKKYDNHWNNPHHILDFNKFDLFWPYAKFWRSVQNLRNNPIEGLSVDDFCLQPLFTMVYVQYSKIIKKNIELISGHQA